MTGNKDACVFYVSPQDTDSGIVTHISTASHFVTIRISARASDIHMALETRPSSKGPSSTGGERPHNMSWEGLKTATPQVPGPDPGSSLSWEATVGKSHPLWASISSPVKWR